MNTNRIPKPANAFILRANVNGTQVYLGKGGQMVESHKQALRFSPSQVKQIAEQVTSETPFIVTPVAR
jgi:hypothetical protein